MSLKITSFFKRILGGAKFIQKLYSSLHFFAVPPNRVIELAAFF